MRTEFMTPVCSKLSATLRRRLTAAMTVLFTLSLPLSAPSAHADGIDARNWGAVTAPVFGTSQAGTYAGAELFAGPNQFGGNYFAGVLPNGRIVNPAGKSVQIGMNPLGLALTPDGKYLITSNDDEREGTLTSLQSTVNRGGYSLSVIDTATMNVVAQINPGTAYIGLAIKYAHGADATGGYTLYASGGASAANNAPGVIRLFNIGANGAISVGTPASIGINPILPANQGYVSHYTVAPGSPAGGSGSAVYRPAGYNTVGAKITFPAGSARSPDGRYLYVACNGDNSLTVIDTAGNTVIKQIPVGYFPYGVTVSRDGSKVFVSNWGVTAYKFANPTYDANGNLTDIAPTRTSGANLPDGFYVAPTSAAGTNPATSSVSVISVPGGDPANATPAGSLYEGQPDGIDAERVVGETHPCASAIVRKGNVEALYVCKANTDSIGLILFSSVTGDNKKLPDLDLSPLRITLADGHRVHGSYPNAIAVSPDNRRAYVAEAGLNSVAVLDTTDPLAPRLLGRIPTGWYPTGVTVSGDGKTLFVINAKGIGEDINPATNGNPTATGVESYTDSNFIFGTAQKIDLTAYRLNRTTVPANNFKVASHLDTSVVPQGGAASPRIKHVFFILGENKTFDGFFGDLSAHFGPYAGINFNAANGKPLTNYQYTQVVPNLRLLAQTFATGVNYYSDAEESDAGHQYCASGTASDYTEKTLLDKAGRGMLVNKNFDAEDYPEGGYLFNNAARHRVNFKLYGLEAARIIGSDTGESSPTKVNDPTSGNAGYPQVDYPTVYNGVAGSAVLHDPFTNPVPNGDVDTATSGVGQSFFMRYPGLAVLGSPNPNGTDRLDRNYPGYNFNISDQRRAREFIRDFDAMNNAGKLPEFLYIYVPNMHTGGLRATNIPAPTGTNPQQVADGDVAIGMIVQHIMRSRVYYDAGSGTGSAIFITTDDAQSTLDHIHPHRTPLIVVSPYARRGYSGKRHYVTASIVKTEELLLGLPPNNYGDLFATDLRDLFQPTYNGIALDANGKLNGSAFTRTVTYQPTSEGRRIWALVKNLDTSGPDRDSHRLGALGRLSMLADDLHRAAVRKGHLHRKQYLALQAHLYKTACALVSSPAPPDSD